MSGLNQYAKYDTMSTEALNELLRQDFLQTGDEELDADATLYIARLLVEREEAAVGHPIVDVEASWQDFRRKFIAPDDLHPGEASLSQHDSLYTNKPKGTSIRILRTLLIAAVITAVLVGAAYAAGVLGWLPKWNSDYFSFSPTKAENAAVSSSQAQDSLEEVLALHNAPAHIVPGYLPAGYEQVDFHYTSSPGKYTTLDCLYSDGVESITLSYFISYNDDRSLFAKDEGEPEVYTTHGRDHYIMTNMNEYTAVWQNDNFECSLSGFKSREELIQAIDSLY